MKSSFCGYFLHYFLDIYIIYFCITSSLYSQAFAKHCTHCFRLPHILEPVIYDLKLTLNSDLEYISGQVLIEIQCKQNTSVIKLHGNSLFLDIQHATLESRLTNETIDLKTPLTNWRDEVVEFKLEGWSLKQASVYYLQIWYTTRYSDDGHGLMRHQDLERGTWINSLFEPVFARRLLPCFDEPKWRTAFKLELWLIGEFAQSSFIALSNTPARITVWNENLTIYVFEPTPPLPIYLFSIAIGRFTSYCNTTALLDNEICIWRFSHLQEWHEMAEKIIQAMSLYQQGMTDYLLADSVARLHLLILPMKLNGMENFGLLNVKESLWPKSGDENSFYAFTRTLYHEMAHQWFGNLVTIDWWDSIWLAEGLTTFASSLRPIVHEPSYDLTKEPLVDSNWLLQARIPPISYTKSAALMEMLESLIGSRRMQKLLRDYIRNFQFHWANTQKFLTLMNSSLSTVDFSPAKAIEFLDSWLVQGSHPIVFIDFDKSLGQFLFSQTPKIGFKSKWLIPIWLECKDGTVPEKLYWIPKHKQLVVDLIQLTTTNSSSKVAFNRNRPVYYQISSR